MSLKNDIIVFVTWWLNLAKTNQDLYKNTFQLLIKSRPDSSYNSQLLSELSQINNIEKFQLETDLIYKIIHDFCYSRIGRKRFSDLSDLFSNLGKLQACSSFTFNYLELLFTLSLLQVLSKTSQPH